MPDAHSKLSVVEFRNARSWVDARLDLSPGLNVFVGESDSGKTNVVRNLRSLVENSPLDVIRTAGVPEKTEASVTLTDAAGASFVLSRSESLNACSAEGPVRDVDLGHGNVGQSEDAQGWTAVGNGTPDAYRARLMLSPIDLSGFEADVHFSDQRDPLFVVDAPPSAVAKIVGAVSGLDVLYRAVAAGDKERRDARSSVASWERLVLAARQRRDESAAVLVALTPLAEAVKAASARECEASARLTAVRAARDAYAAARARALALKRSAEALRSALAAARSSLDAVAPVVDARDALARALAAYAAAQESHRAAQARSASARSSFDAVLRGAGDAKVPCPTCGTPVPARRLAGA